MAERAELATGLFVEESAVSVNAGSRPEGVPMRLLPMTPRGTWLLAGAIWLAGCGALWWVLPYRPRAEWPTDGPAVVHGFIPGTAVVLTSMPWSTTLDGTPSPMVGPLLARNAATGEVREWFPDGERLSLVDPGVDGKHVLVGRVIDGRARLFLHDATSGMVIGELARGGPRAENENDLWWDKYAYGHFAEFRPDGRHIVYACRVGDQRWLRVWDTDTRREVAAVQDGSPPLAWSPDGGMLAYTTPVRDTNVCTVHLWDLVTGRTRVLGSSQEDSRRPIQLTFSPDGRTVVAECWPFEVDRSRVPAQLVAWNLDTGKEEFRQPGVVVGFPPVTSWFASSTSALTRKITFHRWENFGLVPREYYLVLPSVGQWWHSFSPDGRLVFGDIRRDDPLSELLNRYILMRPTGATMSFRPELWEADSGRLRYSLPMDLGGDFGGQPRHSWTLDGKLLAIAGEETMMVWDIPPRKSWWFFPLAALLAIPPVWLARRRVRRLHAVAR